MDIEKTDYGYLLTHKGHELRIERQFHVHESYRCMALDKLIAEIERLSTELAAAQAWGKVLLDERDRLRFQAAFAADIFALYARHHAAKTPPDAEKTRINADHAARLRNVVAECSTAVADHSALASTLQQAREEMRERCIEEIRGIGGSFAVEAEAAIRALEVK